MTARSCPVPHCEEALADAPYVVFCPTHHCALPAQDTAFLFRWQMKAARCVDDDIKQHMREQLQGYVAQAVRKLETINTGALH